MDFAARPGLAIGQNMTTAEIISCFRAEVPLSAASRIIALRTACAEQAVRDALIDHCQCIDERGEDRHQLPARR